MNIDRLFSDSEIIEKEIDFFISKKQLKKIGTNLELVKSHIKKAKHNLEFFKLNKQKSSFNDWLIVMLYYTLYHCALALIINKNYSSKNHYATILILIKEYGISKAEASLIEELSINKREAELYTELKQDRHDASYSTGTKFKDNLIKSYEDKVIDFIQKTEELLK